MKNTHRSSVFACLALAILSTVALAQDQDSKPLSDAEIAADLRLPYITLPELPAWRDFIRPTEAEASYSSVDWVPTFADGLRASAELNKPLLFWAMNGHPLGCT